MSELKDYRPTPSAGYYVAGQRVPFVAVTEPTGEGERTREVPDPHHRLRLTEAQARYELLNGTIEEVVEEPAAPVAAQPAPETTPEAAAPAEAPDAAAGSRRRGGQA